MGRRIFRVVGVLGIVVLSLGIWLEWREQAAKADEAERLSRLKPFVEVAPAPLPRGLPLKGDEGTSAEGFPRQWVDQAGLRSLLIHKRFAQLDAAFTHFQDAFEKDPHFERWPADATAAFGSSEPALRPLLDAWAKAFPESFAPRLARGAHLSAVAFAQRGTKVVQETSGVEFAEMRATLPLAHADLERALALRPKVVAALTEEIHLSMLTGDAFAYADAVRRADERCPSCFLHRVAAMQARRPRWGGSYDEMRALAARAPVVDNPRFKLLPGYALLDVAAVAIEDDRPADALTASDEACALGDHWAFLKGRGHVLRHRKEHDAALVDLTRALELRPGNPDVLVERAEVYLEQKQGELAALDFIAALRVNPSHARGEQLYGPVVQTVVFQAWQAHLAGHRLDALRLLDLASQVAPLDGEVLMRRGMVQEATDAGIEELRANAEAAPDDLRAQQALDYALANENHHEEAAERWTRYLARNPEDGRAYMERAGAWNHLGRRPETLADLQKACDLGVTEGCARLRK